MTDPKSPNQHAVLAEEDYEIPRRLGVDVPLTVSTQDRKVYIDSGLEILARVCAIDDRDIADRMAACVNACAGIPTDQLGVVKAAPKLLAALTDALVFADEAFAEMAEDSDAKADGPRFDRWRAAIAKAKS